MDQWVKYFKGILNKPDQRYEEDENEETRIEVKFTCRIHILRSK